MPRNPVASGGSGPGGADATRNIEPSILTALPHYLPLVVFSVDSSRRALWRLVVVATAHLHESGGVS